MNIEIRKSKMTDSENLEKAFQKSLREDFTYYPVKVRKEFRGIWNAKFFRKRKPLVFVAFAKKNVIGFVIGRRQWQDSGVASVDWLWVDERYRKQGVATGLMKSLEQVFIEEKHHKIELNADNILSHGYYEKIGFDVEGNTKDHFWHLDGLYYIKRIKK